MATQSTMCFVDPVSHLYGRYGVPYGTGSCTYCACIAKVAFISIFQFFFIIYTTYRKKIITRPYRKNKKSQFFFIIYTTYFKEKLHACNRKKKLHD